MLNTLAPDKRGYPRNIFLISVQKCMLWVLIRREALLRVPQHMFLCRNKKNINVLGLKKTSYLECVRKREKLICNSVC